MWSCSRTRGQMPVTMLWISNGGRDFPPWNGATKPGVIGIEDGARRKVGTGLAARWPENRLTAMGVPTCCRTVRHPHAASTP